jgi:hypothetical protein
MVRILVLMYEDILKFHHIALSYFQQPRQYLFLAVPFRSLANGYRTEWKQLFKETWKTCKSRFSSIVSSIARHRSLIESQACLPQIEDSYESRRTEDFQFETEMKVEDLRRFQAVYNWLRATNVEADQYHFSKIRADNPSIGRWLLDNLLFKEWFDPEFPTIPPLLWLNGIPGAGCCSNFRTAA